MFVRDGEGIWGVTTPRATFSRICRMRCWLGMTELGPGLGGWLLIMRLQGEQGRFMDQFSRYETTEDWEANVPADLLPAVKALRDSFDDAHWNCGQITEKLGYAALHPGEQNQKMDEWIKPFRQLQTVVGPKAAQRFRLLMELGTPPAIFKAFYDLYLDGMLVQTIHTFDELLQIGRANEGRISGPCIDWAVWHTEQMVRAYVRRIDLWLREVCDGTKVDPDGDFDEQVFGTRWQAPMLLIMEPSRYQPYDPEKNWVRFEVDRSWNIRRGFAEHYVIHLEANLKRVAGQAAVELAKASGVSRNTEPESPDGDSDRKVLHPRREARKLATQDKYKAWQRKYRELKKKRPGKPDSWIAKHIASLGIAKGNSADTIRKHMKK